MTRGDGASWKRRLLLVLAVVATLAVALAAYAYATAIADPVVRRTRIELAALPTGTELRLLLVSDIHVAGPDMPPSRLSRIVDQMNALRPDAVLIAGDFVSDKRVSTQRYTAAEAVAPLARLRTRYGVFAVLGNHDHWRDAAALTQALRSARVRVLDNDAARAGPLAIGGLDDAYTGQNDFSRTLTRMERVGGVPIFLSHSPDPFAYLKSPAVMLAGHTHCGQIRLPLVGAPATASDHGERYACGLVREGDKVLIVSAGLGTSMLPLRLGAVPDMWLVTVAGGAAAR